MTFGQDIAIDLGTATILVYVKGKGIVLREPSVVAIDKDTNEVLAVGNDARKMLGRTPGNIVAIRPLKDGVISDYTTTEKMLKYFINKVCSKFVFLPRIMICVPSCVTEVEKKAVIDAANHAGAKKVYLIEEPIAAAIGAGIDIGKPYGTMIVDIGGGTTDIAVISLGGSVKCKTIKVAGDKFDDDITKYVKKVYNVIIGERTAEDVKINIGCMYKKDILEKMNVKGRDVTSGLPTQIEITSDDTYTALKDSAEHIIDGIHTILEQTPPELLADISTRGIYITGGGGLVYGLDRLIEEKINIPVTIAEDSISCVAIGTGKALNHIELLSTGNALKIKKF
ncbi:MAG: rod shape-determining protein [Clostridia bacterium]